jgi:hypothetical protein
MLAEMADNGERRSSGILVLHLESFAPILITGTGLGIGRFQGHAEMLYGCHLPEPKR